MKLSIKSGESVDHAIQYLSDFLHTVKDEYPILKGAMNIYITLEGFGHKDYPENNKEYILTGESIEDVESQRIRESEKTLKGEWEKFCEYEAEKYLSVAKKVSYAKSALESAEKRNLTSKTIEQRKKNVAHAQNLLVDARARLDIILKLRQAVEHNQAILYTEKIINGKMIYSYTITPYYIFRDIDGYTGYFLVRQYKSNSYGQLCTGLPYNYRA